MVQRWYEEDGFGREVTSLGVPHHAPQWADFQPSTAMAAAACQFRGKTNPVAMGMLMTGRYASISRKVVAKDIIKQWQPNTITTKQRVVRTFFAFLASLGVQEQFFPADGSIPAKTESQSRDEEHSLCQFAMLRMASGQNMSGAAGVVADIRTWYRVMFDAEYGRVGSRGRPSMTSQYLKSLAEYFPPLESVDVCRDPVTWPMVMLMVREARVQRWEDIGVVIAVAFAALLRMGEATSTETSPFNAAEDLAEEHLSFLPTFWQADRVVIRLGRTKADQSGARSRQLPRAIPVDSGADTPGHMLRNLIIKRHRLRPGETPLLGTAPLFQDRQGGQLKRDAVLRFMRTALRKAGLCEEEVMRIGTHSCRIGGATSLFRLGATADVLKQFGGWVSDAWKVYVRLEQEDLMRYTRAMCA
jgi:hypothetical protein